MAKSPNQPFNVSLMRGGILLILLLMPIQAIPVTWLRATFPHNIIFEIWKELLLAFLCIPAVLILWRDRELRRRYLGSRLHQLIGLYAALQLLMWAIKKPEFVAAITGIVINLRFLLMFMLARLVQMKAPISPVQQRKLLLIPAAIVVVFGFLQMTVLPHDILSHVGYSATTIKPFDTVDNKPAFVRVISTMRGANPLAAYLLVPLLVLLADFAARRDKKRGWIALFLAGVILLLGTFSRSALLGFLLGGLFIGLVHYAKSHYKQLITIGAIATLLVASGLYLARNSYIVRNAVYHTDNTSTSQQSSNDQRHKAETSALKDVFHEPFGRGPGTAGPASRRLLSSPGRISENYYLQIGQEIGALGMGLFLVIIIGVGQQLYMRRRNTFALGLLASLIGVSVIGLFLHVWADEDVALVWWGFAGLVLGGRAGKVAQTP